MSTKLLLFNSQGPCPPNGFRYVDPVDGFIAHAWAYNDWVPIQKAHLKANEREVPDDLEEQMQDQLCQTLPPDWCLYDDPLRPRPLMSLGWGDVVGALETFGRWIKNGCQFVDQKEAERRAEICARCYLNTNITGCSACKKLTAEVVGNRSTKFDYALKGCGVCKCVLKAKVWFPINILLDTEREKLQSMYPDHCWLQTNGQNYRNVQD